VILGDIIESLEDCFQRNLIVGGKFFGSARVRAVDGLVDNASSDPSTLEE
jgi:hypothetical protein